MLAAQKELQAAMQKLKLEEAQAALREAQKALEAIRVQQQSSAEAVKLATRERDAAVAAKEGAGALSGETGKADEYGDEKFWEQRYKKRSSQGEGMYEWYLSFDELRELILADLTPLGSKRDVTILVPGCGDSSLCEDLAELQYLRVAGMDYSSSVIREMQQRSNTTSATTVPVRYFQADARRMSSEEDGSYLAVIDKGTLDAIASRGGEGGGGGTASSTLTKNQEEQEEQQGARDAADYMREMWRVLARGGRFVCITTMPPDVFEALAINSVDASGYVCDWSQARRVKLNTAEGGEVHYYAITKKNTPLRSERGKQDIMAGIQALLAEAAKAKEDLVRAQESCAEKIGFARAAKDALVGAEAEQAKLAKKLEGSLEHVKKDASGGFSGAGGDMDEEENMFRSMRKMSIPVDENGQTEPAVVVATTPTVSLLIVEHESSLVAGGVVVVEFSFPPAGEATGDGGETWEQDDAIHLQCFSCTASVSNSSSEESTIEEEGRAVGGVALYSNEERLPYEQLEYTQRPSKRKEANGRVLMVGRVSISLPTFSSLFSLKYVRTSSRTHTAPSETGNGQVVSIVRSMKELGSSKVFSVVAPVQATDSKGLRRRSVANYSCTSESNFDVLVEDLKNIHTLLVTIAAVDGGSLSLSSKQKMREAPATRQTISKAMAWCISPSASSASVLIEADVNTVVFSSSSSSSSSETIHSSSLSLCELKYCSLSLGVNLILEGAQIEVDMHSGRLLCRFPYQRSADAPLLPSPLPPPPPVATSFPSSASSTPSPSTPAIVCGFCEATLISGSSVDTTSPLPSGVFDNMMHEFICSESAPSLVLCTSDMTTPARSLLTGPLHVTANPQDIVEGALVLECKGSSNILDLFSGYGGSLATTPLVRNQASSTYGVEGAGASGVGFDLPSLVNIDTCALVCARCSSYLGDGQLAGEAGDGCPCPAHLFSASKQEKDTTSEDAASAAAKEEVEASSFAMNDLRDIRFVQHCVAISPAFLPYPSSPPLSSLLAAKKSSGGGRCTLAVEQAVARSLTHLGDVFGVASFVIGNEDTFTSRKNQGDSVVIKMRLLSRDYALAYFDKHRLQSTRIAPHLSNNIATLAIKVSFWVGKRSLAALTGTEARIPLQYHELNEVAALLESRSTLFGKSVLKRQHLAFLFT